MGSGWDRDGVGMGVRMGSGWGRDGGFWIGSDPVDAAPNVSLVCTTNPRCQAAANSRISAAPRAPVAFSTAILICSDEDPSPQVRMMIKVRKRNTSAGSKVRRIKVRRIKARRIKVRNDRDCQNRDVVRPLQQIRLMRQRHTVSGWSRDGACTVVHARRRMHGGACMVAHARRGCDVPVRDLRRRDPDCGIHR